MGSDDAAKQSPRSVPHFNPHSPHGERPRARSLSREYVLFQSTLPAWGATEQKNGRNYTSNISIHASRMGSDRVSFSSLVSFHISIHAPAWGATNFFLLLYTVCCISIHAPRMGSDQGLSAAMGEPRYFNPRSPHGERHTVLVYVSLAAGFQSTLPAWGATEAIEIMGNLMTISIHAPRMGSDPPIRAKMTTSHIFQSTLPHGERHT